MPAETPLARREGQPVPETRDEALPTFHCQAYLCDLTGSACAVRHLQARQTRAANRDACIECPAGAARAALFGIAVTTCAATEHGKPCLNAPEEGMLFCRRHRFTARRQFVDPGVAVQMERKARKPATVPAVEAEANKPARAAGSNARKASRRCAACQHEMANGGRKPHPLLTEWCSLCAKKARDRLKRRGVECTPEAVADELRTPSPAKKLAPRPRPVPVAVVARVVEVEPPASPAVAQQLLHDHHSGRLAGTGGERLLPDAVGLLEQVASQGPPLCYGAPAWAFELLKVNRWEWGVGFPRNEYLDHPAGEWPAESGTV